MHLFAAYISRPHRRQFEATWETADRVLGYLSEENGAVLFETVQVVRPRTLLEIGSFLGRSTVLLALAQRSAGIADARLVTVDPHRGQHTPRDDPDAEIDPVTLGVFRQSLARAGVEALVEPWVMTSGEAAHRWKEPIDLLYVDGWHSFDAVMDDARSFLPYLSPSGVVIFDDYSHPLWPGVGKAVHALVEEGAFHLWGPVFTQAMGGTAPVAPAGLQPMLRLCRLKDRWPRLRHRHPPSGRHQGDGRSPPSSPGRAQDRELTPVG